MSKLLKDKMSPEKVGKLAALLNFQMVNFERECFVDSVFCKDWHSFSLKQRIRHISQLLNQFLAGSFKDKVRVLKLVSIEFDGLFHFIFADFIELYGLHDYKTSIEALELFTQNSTAEFAIRLFIEDQPERTKQQLLIWSQSSNEHLRRLASEGVRPKLPWAKHLPWVGENPEWVRPIIEHLLADSSRYVQKSVANLLNDLSKTQPEWLLNNATLWLKQSTNKAVTQWIIKHALRTLLKQGHSQALALIGYKRVNNLSCHHWQLEPSVEIGKRLFWSFHLNSKQPLGKLRVEYALSFLRNKQGPYRKVFKIIEGDFDTVVKEFHCQHNFKVISTRKYYPGQHKIELIVNGQVIQQAEFELQQQS